MHRTGEYKLDIKDITKYDARPFAIFTNFSLDCQSEDYDKIGTTCVPKQPKAQQTYTVIVVISALVLFLFSLLSCLYYWRYSARVQTIRCSRIVQHYVNLAGMYGVLSIGDPSNRGGKFRHDSTLEMTALTSKLFVAPEELSEVSRKRNLFRSPLKLTTGTDVADQPDHNTLLAAETDSSVDSLHGNRGKIVAAEGRSAIIGAQHEELRAYLNKRTMRRQYTPLHCAAVCNAKLRVVKSMVQMAPAAVAIQDYHGLDAVQVAVNHAASCQLVAELVVGCLQAGGVVLDGWHTILERSDCGGYVTAAVSLAQQGVAAKRQSSDQPAGRPRLLLRSGRSRRFTPRPPPIALQVTSATVEAVEQLAYALDSKHRKGIDVAAHDNKSILETAILYRGRYDPRRSSLGCCVLHVRNLFTC